MKGRSYRKNLNNCKIIMNQLNKKIMSNESNEMLMTRENRLKKYDAIVSKCMPLDHALQSELAQWKTIEIWLESVLEDTECIGCRQNLIAPLADCKEITPMIEMEIEFLHHAIAEHQQKQDNKSKQIEL